MDAYELTLDQLRYELRLAKAGRGLDRARIEQRIAEVMAERDAAEDRYQESLARVRADLWTPKYKAPEITYHQALGLVEMGMDETLHEARSRAEREN